MKIKFIINPVAGKPDSVLEKINSVMSKTKFIWDVYVTKGEGSAEKDLSGSLNDVDIIVIYGGDGTVSEIINIVYEHEIPLLILQGGTGNVLAKQLNIPGDIENGLKILTSGYSIKSIDLCLYNNETVFVLKAIHGKGIEVIGNTKRKVKRSLGIAAYILEMIRNFDFVSKSYDYKLSLDGKEYTKTGSSLIIANSTYLTTGIIDMKSPVSISDGKIEAIVVDKFNPDIFSDMAKFYFKNKKKRLDQIEIFSGKHIEVSLDDEEKILVDEKVLKTKDIVVDVLPSKLKVVVPESRNNYE